MGVFYVDFALLIDPPSLPPKQFQPEAEEIRLRYRFLDLRRQNVHESTLLRKDAKGVLINITGGLLFYSLKYYILTFFILMGKKLQCELLLLYYTP